jgi:glutathione peroxidase
MSKSSMVFLFLLQTVTAFSQKSVYDHKISSLNGRKIDFSNLRNKLIVVVNIASGSDRSVQLLQLDTLCRKYASQGLVVVAFPTNDFNKEPKNDKEIKTWTSGLHANLVVAGKTRVKGEAKSPFYNWCTNKSENGMVNMEVVSDFQKFIISKEGKVIGVYPGALSPLSEPFTKAIDNNINK